MNAAEEAVIEEFLISAVRQIISVEDLSKNQSDYVVNEVMGVISYIEFTIDKIKRRIQYES